MAPPGELRVKAGVVCWQVKLCDPHLSTLEVRFSVSRRGAIQIDYLYLYLCHVKSDFLRKIMLFDGRLDETVKHTHKSTSSTKKFVILCHSMCTKKTHNERMFRSRQRHSQSTALAKDSARLKSTKALLTQREKAKTSQQTVPKSITD